MSSQSRWDFGEHKDLGTGLYASTGLSLVSIDTTLSQILFHSFIYRRYLATDFYLGKVVIQLDATMNFIQCPLSQHVSGINMPIIRRTMQRTTAYDVQHCNER
jgi:hypothetical protein